MEFLLIGAAGLAIYNLTVRVDEPKVEDGIKPGIALPAPRFLWSKPELWSSCPVEISDRPGYQYIGPLKDPRTAYILPGGARVAHSGKNQRISRLDTTWNVPVVAKPSGPTEYTGEFKVLHITDQ